MIRSMTGFGAASREVDGRLYSVEIRSLNARYYKGQVRLPDELSGLEAELEATLSRKLSRGSVTMVVKFGDRSAAAAGVINLPAVSRYMQQLSDVPGLDGKRFHVDLGTVLQLPGAVHDSPAEGRLDEARPVLTALLDDACDELIGMREREGEALLDELSRHHREIHEHLTVIRERAPEVVHQYQERLRSRMNALLEEAGATARDEDLLREVAVFAERSDIDEEVTRLAGHLDQFDELIRADGTRPVGRTLDFIAQEMLREANTIGSKCLDTEVGRRTVEIKGRIDRLKEQVQNVE
ncbi:MAG: YicC/YloC family endoribonuclease [Phycisphaerales bacterium]